jgi:PST family polysaccharide transporter
MSAVAAPLEPRRSWLVSSALALWLAQGLTVLGGLVRGKVGAVELGPEGMGLVAQLNYLSTFLAAIAALGVSNGCIKLLAEARATQDDVRDRQVRSILLVYPLVAGSLLAVVIGAAAAVVGPLLLGSDSHRLAIVVAAVSVPLSMAAGSFAVALQGRESMRRLAGGNGVVAVANTAIVVGSIVAFGLAGAIASVALTSLAALIVFAIREPGLFRGISLRLDALFDRRLLRVIYAFGVASVLLSVASGAVDLGVRTLIVHRLGLDANGLYQPVALLSSQLFLAIVGGVGMYLFPRLTGLYATGRTTDAHHEVNAAVRLVLVVIVPAVVLLVAFGGSVLGLLFSAEFRGAQPTLDYQLLGEVFRAIGWTVGSVLLPLGLVKHWFLLGLATLGGQAVLSPLLIGPLGLPAVGVGYAASWALGAALALLVARWKTGFRLDRATAGYALIGAAVAVAVVGLARAAHPLSGVGAVLLAAALAGAAAAATLAWPRSFGIGGRR